MSICTVAVNYIHGSLLFSKKAAVHDVLECYMHGSLLFSKNTAVAIFWNAICTAVSFARPPVSLLIKPGNKTKEFW